MALIQRSVTRLTDQDDVRGLLSALVDGYALVYDHAAKAFVLSGEVYGAGPVGVRGVGVGAICVGVRGEASGDDNSGVMALGSGGAWSLQIGDAPVDGGNQRYTSLADATAAMDALNRQTGDARYAPIAMATHAMLSTVHSDSTAAAVVRGDLLAGIGTTPKWARLAKGSQYAVLGQGADEPAWSGYLLTGTSGGKTNLAVTSGKTLTLTAANDYNLTVPATGTAALLGVANAYANKATWTYTDGGTTTDTALVFSHDVTASDHTAATFRGIQGFARLYGTKNYTGTSQGFQGGIVIYTTGTVGTASAADFYVYNTSATTLTTVNALNLSIYNDNVSGVITTAAGLRIATPTNTGTIGTTYGIIIANQVAGTQTNYPYAIFTGTGLVHLGDSVDLASGKNITLLAGNLITDTTTGTKIGTATGQKLGFWNATPIVQPTTAIAAATFTANTSGIANDTATWDGYTVGQAIKALRNAGILA